VNKTNKIIEQFNKVHNFEYDYGLVDYQGIDNKVKIICEKHGVFEQTCANHRSGNKCPKCQGYNLSSDDWVDLFKKIHGNRYDYSRVKVVNSLQKIDVICNKHGLFRVSPNNHYRMGTGCSKCGNELRGINQTLTTEFVIEQFQSIHQNRYDYSLVDYSNSHNKVKIICEKHGVFEQSPVHHKSGCGCPLCGLDIRLNGRPTYLYYIKTGNQYKIGITKKGRYKKAEDSIMKRYFQEVKLGIPIEILTYRLFEDGLEAYNLEQLIINEYKNKLILRDEMILISGYTETFKVNIMENNNELQSIFKT